MSSVWRWRWLVLAGSALAGTASAANFEVSGVQLGMTQPQVEAARGDKIECAARAPSDTDPSQMTCVSAEFAKSKALSDTFAGQKTVIRYHLLDGHVARISFLGLPSLAFDQIVKTMETTYGKAEVESKVVRFMKSELVNKRAAWRNDAGDAIVFDKFSPGNLDRSYLNFYANSWPQNLRPKPIE